VGVVGASGGLGVSTLAVALASRAGPSLGVTVCVDTAGSAGARGGLDVTACLEHLPGLRTALEALLDDEREQYLEKG